MVMKQNHWQKLEQIYIYLTSNTIMILDLLFYHFIIYYFPYVFNFFFQSQVLLEY